MGVEHFYGCVVVVFDVFQKLIILVRVVGSCQLKPGDTVKVLDKSYSPLDRVAKSEYS